MERNVEWRTISKAIKVYTGLDKKKIDAAGNDFYKIVDKIFYKNGFNSGKPLESEIFTELPPNFISDKMRISNLR